MEDATASNSSSTPNGAVPTVDPVDAVADPTILPDENQDDDVKEEPPYKKLKVEDESALEEASRTASIALSSDVSEILPSTISNVSNADVKTEPFVADQDAASSIAGEQPPKMEEPATIPENEDDDDLFGDGDDENDDTVKDPEVHSSAVTEMPFVGATEPFVQQAESTVYADPSISNSLQNEPDQPSSAATEISSPTGAEVAIPRKSNSATKTLTPVTLSSPAPQKTNFIPGTRFGLPPGVNVPLSIVQSKLLEAEMNTPGSKLMDVLKSLPVNLINDALTEYDDAVEIKGANSIRNHGAYLYGVVKRYVSVHERSLKGEGSGILPMGEDGLTDLVQERLELLVTTGFCSVQEMNDKVKSKIRMLSEKDAIFALDELSSVERSSIRNFGSYFMGILNRYMRGDASSKIRPPFNPGGPSQHHPKQGHPQSRERDRFAPPNQFSSSSRNPSNPRDRFENRGPPMGGMPGPRSPPYHMDNAYDHHQQQQPPSSHGWQNQPPHHLMGGAPPMYQGGGGNMSHFAMNNTNPMGPSVVNGQSMPGMPQSFQQQQQPYGQPQFMQQQGQSYGLPSSGYPPNNSVQQSIPSSSSTGMYQSSMMGQPQAQPHTSSQHPQYSSQQQPSVMSQPSQFVSDSQGSIDILGLADKAASAIQALGANKLNAMSQGYPSQHLGLTSQQQQPQQQAYPPYAGGMQPAMGQLPQMGMPQSNLAPHQAYLPPNQQQQFGAPGSLNRMDAPTNQGNRRRTTASFNELPVTVQYALQNLIATGAIDGQPDDGILGMILDLPEQMALVGLQKFASIDKSTMRNKFAYLAGVLRRELEKIHRR